MRGSVKGNHAEMTVDLTVQIRDEGWVQVPLHFDQVVLLEAHYKGPGEHILSFEPKGDGLPTTTPFTLDGEAPPAPQILAPADDATGVSLTPTIRWTAATGAARYGVLVTTTNGSVVFAESVLGGGETEVTIPASLGLSAGTKYRLEIRVVTDDGDRAVGRGEFRT